jgi:hypothetical protein
MFLMLALTLLAWPRMAMSADEDVEEVDEDARACISSRTLRQTVIIDDRTILFYASGNKAYINTLPRACRGLKREGRFSYRTSVGQICDIDSISVLNSFAGGLQEGINCRLGKFIPISHEDADALRDPPPQEPPPTEVPLPEPEEIGAEPVEPEAPGS